MFISVDFPEPEAPMMATNSASAISSEMSSRAVTVTSPMRYILLTRSSWISGGKVRSQRSEKAAARTDGHVRDESVARLNVSLHEFRPRSVSNPNGNWHAHRLAVAKQPDCL